MSDLTKRVLVSVIFIPVLILALFFEGIPLYVMFLAVSLLGAQEYRSMLRQAGYQISWVWVLIIPLLYGTWVLAPGSESAILWVALFLVILEALAGWTLESSVPQMFATIFAVVYTGLFPAMIVKIGWYQPVKKILLALILMIWIVDTVAYFIGMRFGTRRGITPVSPRKSLQGFIAGLLAPGLVLLILYVSGFSMIPWPILVMIAIAAGIFGQLGDLLESMLKRFCGVKDSSHLIPGHGGVLDRTDSILLAGAFLYSALNIINM
ncbi:MAG: phosphatidate cytidylyltransferase [Candidatus Cloacimonetes bacterium]|jgi:phosphatidate cytidylyltransferase|nr:phosphatidate cytidylyltransferase [Candidatus Cloacimonadota bacterium]MDY0337875.1 phosphatidate cytidylyltransferase [Candidatus Cloacimonadaceae bacterium]MCB5268641.1 phosphatidate cytidylyltransferase [Candidatus Cloacimonadota bacterium]MCK9334618.1 phosphatidate cytidylyltransferase [Candidatus Cloacimonadota bacterium]MDD2542800.1 phosphatidate cytidylyltransferase [Candidatus Cloacimonadota bacterium]